MMAPYGLDFFDAIDCLVWDMVEALDQRELYAGERGCVQVVSNVYMWFLFGPEY